MKRSSKVIVLGLVACLTVVLIVTSGCQFAAKKAAEEAVEKTTGVKVEGEEETPLKKVDTSDIPNEFIYPGSKATERFKMTAGGGETIHVTFETSDKADEIEKYYDQKPTAAGWKQTTKIEQDGIAYSWSKGDSYVGVGIEEREDKTTIELTLQNLENVEQ